MTLRDAAVVSLTLAVYLFLLSLLVPYGVNHVFSDRTWRRLLTIALLLFAWLLLQRRWTHPGTRRIETPREIPPPGDLLLVLLPLTPIVQYMLLNQSTLSLIDGSSVVAVFLLLSLLVGFVVPYVLGGVVSRPLLMIASIVLVFMVANMASLADRFAWHLKGELNVQHPVFAAVLLTALLLYQLKRELLYVVVVGFFLSGVLISASTVEDRPASVDTSRLYDLTADKDPKRTPDIYLLTYDSYVENRTMLQYGIDNSAQEALLEAQGFVLYRGMYSIGGSTFMTMGNMLSPHGDVYRAVSGDGDVQRALKHHGYETHGVFKDDYFFRRHEPSYDRSYPPAVEPLLLWRAVFEGEFRFNVGMEDVSVEEFLEKKRALMQSPGSAPRFVHSLTGPSHSQNSGRCLNDETERFEARLKVANQEMRGDVEAILSSKRDAIVIIHGDHGPYLTKNCHSLMAREFSADSITRLDVQDRLGTFLAIRWPDDGEHDRFDQMAVLQHVFPAVFAYLFDDESLLDARIDNTLTESAVRWLAGVSVVDGAISGGPDDGKPLFEPQ